MTSVSDSNGSSLFSATYTRDSDGQLASDGSQASNQADYKYTGLNQLCYAGSSSTNACGSPPASSYPYAFDNADDLTSNNGTTQQYNAADELCWTYVGANFNACGSAPSGSTSFNYNNKGDRTSEVPSSGSATCDGYDQANLLTSVKTGTGSSCTSPTTVGTYAYDGDGLRESKTVSGTTTEFTWDGAGDDLLQQDAGGTITSFMYGPGDLPVEQITSSTTTYLHHDQLGSTRLITDSAGATGTATTITYDPGGNQVSLSGSLTTPLLFSGEYEDAETGLYYLRARYYDPVTSQFLTVDPAVAATMSPYAYVAGNPLNETDPTGLDSEPVAPGPSFEGPGYPGGPPAVGSPGCNPGFNWAAALPTGNVEFPYVPGTKGNKPIKLPGNQGWRDKFGNRWVWDNNKNEWDVQHPNGTHTNVDPDGEKTHGPDNFPQNPNPGWRPPQVSPAVAGAAAVIITIGTIIVLSPAGA
jgi:RHS repeat-associated protein